MSGAAEQQTADQRTGKRLPDDQRKIAEALVQRYPTRRASVLMVLRVMERTHGTVDLDGMEEAAEICGISPAEVLGIQRFYTHYSTPGKGRHRIMLCHTFPCALRGAAALGEHIKSRLGIEYGETTDDGEFSLEKAECLGACDKAPMIQLGEEYHEELTPDAVDRIIDALRDGEEPSTPAFDRLDAVPDMADNYRGIVTDLDGGD